MVWDLSRYLLNQLVIVFVEDCVRIDFYSCVSIESNYPFLFLIRIKLCLNSL